MDGIHRRPLQRHPRYRSPDLVVVPRRMSGSISKPFAHDVAHAKKPPDQHLKQHALAAKRISPTVTQTKVFGVRHEEPVVSRPKSYVPPAHPVPLPTKKPKRKTRKKTVWVIYGAAAVVLGVGVVLAYQAYRANQAVETQITRLTSEEPSTGSANLPTNEKPKDPEFVANYKVAPLVPQHITINKISVHARVLQVGVDKDGRMDAPKTAYDAAWYTGSSRPGEQGAMVIDGHVQGAGGDAVFTDLKKLVAGDTIEITRGDGKKFAYTVVSIATVGVNEVDMGKLLVSQDTARPGLNLITCGGSFDADSGQFDQRTVVYALQN